MNRFQREKFRSKEKMSHTKEKMNQIQRENKLDPKGKLIRFKEKMSQIQKQSSSNLKRK